MVICCLDPKYMWIGCSTPSPSTITENFKCVRPAMSSSPLTTRKICNLIIDCFIIFRCPTWPCWRWKRNCHFEIRTPEPQLSRQKKSSQNNSITNSYKLFEEWNQFEIDCQERVDKRSHDDDMNNLNMKRKGHFLLLRKRLFPVLFVWLSPFTRLLWLCFTRISHRLILESS